MKAEKSRLSFWLSLIGLAILLPVALFSGVWEYMNATATPLHADPGAVPSATRSAPSARWADAVEQGRKAIRAAIVEQNLPGLSVAVGVEGEAVWAEGFGWADLDKRAVVTPDTRFGIGTASTALTSAAAGLLLEKGRLKLDEKIQTHVPQFPEKKWPVTLGQVMGHMAGIRSDGGDEGPLFSKHCDRPIEALPDFADRPLLFQPGTRYRYSRYGWIVVSAAIEAAAEEPFLAFMRTRVFEPLGMHDTLADSDSATEVVPRRANSYFPRFAGDPRYGPDPMRELRLSCYSGASVFVSTPTDLVRFGMAMSSGKLLQPATVQLLQASRRLPSGQETGYGLGWDVESVDLAGEQTRAVGHDGDVLGGMVASLVTFREAGIVVSVTSNISYADTWSLALKVAQAFAARGR